MMKLYKTVNSIQETEDFAKQLGKNLRGGECIEFVSDLGGGKTMFIKNLVEATGSKDVVTSPTFTIGKLYKSPILNIHHYDFYRLHEPGVLAEELNEIVDSKDTVFLIEWGETVKEVLPKERIIIHIDKMADNPEGRKYSVEVPEKFTYVVEGVTA